MCNLVEISWNVPRASLYDPCEAMSCCVVAIKNQDMSRIMIIIIIIALYISIYIYIPWWPGSCDYYYIGSSSFLAGSSERDCSPSGTYQRRAR